MTTPVFDKFSTMDLFVDGMTSAVARGGCRRTAPVQDAGSLGMGLIEEGRHTGSRVAGVAA
jgi:hypothetical protein